MTDDEKQKQAIRDARVRELEAIVEHAGDVLRDEIARLKAEIVREKASRNG
jgi:uncharacterized small protein (DUF1192 family)